MFIYFKIKGCEESSNSPYAKTATEVTDIVFNTFKLTEYGKD